MRKNPVIQDFSSSEILEVIIIRQKCRSYYICYFDVNKYNEYFLRIWESKAAGFT